MLLKRQHSATSVITGNSTVSSPGKRTLVSRHAQQAGVAEHARSAVALAQQSAASALPADLHGRLGESLGADVSAVRVHTGAASAEAADALQANAFALGQDVHFASGAYQPGSPEGDRLIAHEVAHTVQQTGAASIVQEDMQVSSPGDAHETEAESFAQAFAFGRTLPAVHPIAAGTASRAVIQCDGPSKKPSPTTHEPTPGGTDWGDWLHDRLNPIPEDIQQMDLAACKTAVKADWAQLLKARESAIDQMSGFLTNANGVTGSGLSTAVSVVAGAAAGALGVMFPGVLAGALVWGASNFVAAMGAALTQSANLPIDVSEFLDVYGEQFAKAWAGSEGHLLARMATDAEARRALADLRRTSLQHIRAAQKGEVLDTWENAVLRAASGAKGEAGRPALGEPSFHEPVAGRLHLSGAEMAGGVGAPAKWLRGPTSATLMGLKGEAASLILKRDIEDINIVRTMEIGLTCETRDAETPESPAIHINRFSIAVDPSGEQYVQGDLDTTEQAKRCLASFYLRRALPENLLTGADQIEKYWREGLDKVWNKVFDNTPEDLGISQLG